MLLVALGILVFLGAQSSPRPAPPKPHPTGYHGLPDFTQDAEGTQAEMKKLALRTRGDYSKLTDDEKTWMEGVTGSHGDMTLRLMAKRFLAEEQKKKAGKLQAPAGSEHTKAHLKTSPTKPQKSARASGATRSQPAPSRPAPASPGK